jgi:hypothetical protein
MNPYDLQTHTPSATPIQTSIKPPDTTNLGQLGVNVRLVYDDCVVH